MNKNLQEQQERDKENDEDGPKFGRLLLVLLFAVTLVVVITFASEAYYSH